MEALLLITGAGASYDMVDGRLLSGLTQNAYAPLLTKDIFAIKGVGHINDKILHKSERVMFVASEFTTRHGSGSERSIEQYLDDLKNSRIVDDRNHYLVTPIFLQELFLKISDNYLVSGGDVQATNYYRMLMDFERGKYDRLIWVNLNYDLFGDRAIKNLVGNDLLFRKMDEYLEIKTPAGKEIFYLKPHGSVDWVHRIMPHRDLTGNPIYYDEKDIKSGQIPEDFISNYISPEVMTEHEFFVHVKQGGKFPAISVPIGKYSPLKADHIGVIKPHLKGTTDILCIGFSALDDDVFDLINNDILDIKRLLIVTGGQDAGEVIKRFREKCSHEILFKDTDILMGEGFSRFINTRSRTWI